MTGKIYFVECAGRIKIGYSRDVLRRLRQLSTASALKFDLIGEIDGSKHLESAIHKFLSEYRQHGEWFLDCEPVRAAISGLHASGPAHIGFTEPSTSPRRELAMPHRHRQAPASGDPEIFRSPLRPALTRIDYCMERYIGERIAEANDREKRMGLPCGTIINPIIGGYYSIDRAGFAICFIRDTLDATEALLDASNDSLLSGALLDQADLVPEATFYADRLERGLTKLFENPDVNVIDVSGFDGATVGPDGATLIHIVPAAASSTAMDQAC